MWRMIAFIGAALWSISTAHAEQHLSIFREAAVCLDNGSFTSICVSGTVPRDMKITLVTKDQVMPATFVEEPSDADVFADRGTVTRVKVRQVPPQDTFMIAVLAPTEAVKVIRQIVSRDDRSADKIKRYVATKHFDALKTECANPDDKCRLNTRVIRLSPSTAIGEAHYRSKSRLMFDEVFLVRKQSVDMRKGFPDEGSVGTGCGGLELAFQVYGRLHTVTTLAACESDAGVYRLIHDLSGSSPRLVTWWDSSGA